MLIMGALQYSHVPGFAALILRRDFPRLAQPGAIMDRAVEWLSSYKEVRWNKQEKVLKFPSGARIQFGYVNTPGDRRRYQSSEFQYVAWDESTEFVLPDTEENPYLFLMSRVRRARCPIHFDSPKKTCHHCRRRALLSLLPLRIRCASNPGGVSHDFFLRRFISDKAKAELRAGHTGTIYYRGFSNTCRDCKTKFYTPNVPAAKCVKCESVNLIRERDWAFFPALLKDNPAISFEEYMFGLSHLPEITRLRLANGDWSVVEGAILSAANHREFQVLNRGREILVPLKPDGDPLGLNIASEDCHRFAIIDTAGTEETVKEEKKGKQSNLCVQIWEDMPQSRILFLRYQYTLPGAKCNWDSVKAGCENTLRRWKPHATHIENKHWGGPLYREFVSDNSMGGTYHLLSPEGKSKLARSTTFQGMHNEGRIFVEQTAAKWRDTVDAEWFAWSGDEVDQDDSIDCASYACNLRYKPSAGGTWGGPVTPAKKHTVARTIGGRL
jgi:hypothetical protein